MIDLHKSKDALIARDKYVLAETVSICDALQEVRKFWSTAQSLGLQALTDMTERGAWPTPQDRAPHELSAHAREQLLGILTPVMERLVGRPFVEPTQS